MNTSIHFVTGLVVILPLVITALWAAWSLRGDDNRARLRTLLIAWLIVLALLDLSGAVRGEVGRIWLLLLWPTALAAGTYLATQQRRAVFVAAILLLQVGHTLIMRHYLTIYSIL